jgi:hypothetical protein
MLGAPSAEVFHRTEDPDAEGNGEEAAEPTLLPARESL